MELKSFLRRCAVIPLRHVGLAMGTGAAVGLGFWIEARLLPVEYTSSALLSYQVPHQFLADGSGAASDAPTVRIADSVLGPSTLLVLADQVHFAPVRSAYPTDAALSARAASFRSHFDLEQPAPGLLQVTYRGRDDKQVAAATNALAGSLAAWVAKPAAQKSPDTTHTLPAKSQAAPTPAKPVVQAAVVAPAKPPAAQFAAEAPAPAAKRKAADLQHRAATIEENIATLFLQQQTIEARILARINEEKSVERSLQKASANSTGASTDAGAAAVSSAREHLASVEKDLVSLRELRSTVVEEEANEREQTQAFKAQAAALLAAAPAVAPAVAQAAAPAEPVAQNAAKAADVVVPVATPPSHADETPAATDVLNSADETQQPSWQGAFSVLIWGEKPHPLGDETRQMLQWSGIVAGVLVFLAYLALVAWRFRPVSNPASLRSVLPRGVKYFGAVAGSPLAGSSLATSSFSEKSL